MTKIARVLGMFAKRPRPGEVKTRLAAQTSPAWAAQVADAFLRDLVERLAAIDAQRVLVFAPDGEQGFFAELTGSRFLLAPQGPGDLGARMARFFAAQLASAERVVLVGADSPSLPLDYIDRAFAELERADLVLGPATDGGYYLVGCARTLPPIFAGIAWSGPTVLADTVARWQGVPGRLAVLPPWYDVDTLDDWRMLQGHLAALRHAGVDTDLPHTWVVPPPP